MRSRSLVIILALTCALLAGCGAGAVSGAGTSAGSAAVATLIKDRCARCHSIDRIRSARKTTDEWTRTVTRMRGKGATLSDAEAGQVVDFLAGGGGSGL